MKQVAHTTPAFIFWTLLQGKFKRATLSPKKQTLSDDVNVEQYSPSHTTRPRCQSERTGTAPAAVSWQNSGRLEWLG